MWAGTIYPRCSYRRGSWTQTCTTGPPQLVQCQPSSPMTSRQPSTLWSETQLRHTRTWWKSTGTKQYAFNIEIFLTYTHSNNHRIFFSPTQYFRDAWSDQSCSLRKHHQKTEVIILPRKWFKFPKLLAIINTNCSLAFREGTGIQKFKRGSNPPQMRARPRRRKSTQTQERHISHKNYIAILVTLYRHIWKIFTVYSSHKSMWM